MIQSNSRDPDGPEALQAEGRGFDPPILHGLSSHLPGSKTPVVPAPTAAESAARELGRTLSRHFRLAAAPRWARYPATSAKREAQRLELLASWRGRSADAWAAMETRLWNARARALATGALVAGSERYREIGERYADARRRRVLGRAIDAAIADVTGGAL